MFKGIFLMLRLLIIGISLIHCRGEAASRRILLVPLDSRPPCTDFVIDAGKIANLELIIPPSHMLDYFTIPSETSKLRNWTLETAQKSDAIVLSIDQLLYGGLIASRETELKESDIEILVNFLKEIKFKFPEVPMYAFSVLPRMAPPTSIDNFYQRRALTAYSRLIGQRHAGKVADDESFVELYSEISSENMKIYLSRFLMSERLNRRLIDLARSGILDRLIIAFDDAEKYSMQDVIVDNLHNDLYNETNLYSDSSMDRISFIHGADEIALTLLVESVLKTSHFKPKVFIEYNKPSTADNILPFMAIPIEVIVQEKINQFNCTRVDDINQADFILFVSVNSDSDSTLRIDNANSISKFIKKGKKVALVDLSVHFDKEETLLPILLKCNVPINSFIAYAGWNTASNSIGTAFSQAILFVNSQLYHNPQSKFSAFIENIRFLNQRIIEDQFYLKDGIDTVNHALLKSGSYDTSYLDYGTEYEFASFVMNAVMNKRIADYKVSKAFRTPIPVDFEGKTKVISVKDFDFSASYPWPRTFEIRFKIDNLVVESK